MKQEEIITWIPVEERLPDEQEGLVFYPVTLRERKNPKNTHVTDGPWMLGKWCFGIERAEIFDVIAWAHPIQGYKP